MLMQLIVTIQIEMREERNLEGRKSYFIYRYPISSHIRINDLIVQNNTMNYISICPLHSKKLC